jgi:hypothetical protein
MPSSSDDGGACLEDVGRHIHLVGQCRQGEIDAVDGLGGGLSEEDLVEGEAAVPTRRSAAVDLVEGWHNTVDRVEGCLDEWMRCPQGGYGGGRP